MVIVCCVEAPLRDVFASSQKNKEFAKVALHKNNNVFAESSKYPFRHCPAFVRFGTITSTSLDLEGLWLAASSAGRFLQLDWRLGMQKKLLAVAVAGVLAAPAVALAQSSVTISGVFKISLDNINLGDFNTSKLRGTTNTGNNSETRIADDSSRIIFGVREDLGGGLAAVAQVDMRFQPDGGGIAANGNSHVGLQSKSWGTLTVGRHDQHYFNTESRLTSKAGSLKADAISIIAYAGGGYVPISNASRTPNNIKYTSPNWSGFTFLVGYSTNPLAAGESDIASTSSRGDGWNINPNFQGANWQVGYSYWRAENDAGVGAAATVAGVSGPVAAALPALFGGEQRGDRLYGSYTWGGLRVGLAWDQSKIEGANTLLNSANRNNGATLSDRTAWTIPIEYVTGNHNFLFHYTKAEDDKSSRDTFSSVKSLALAGVCGGAPALGLGDCDSSASMYSLAYVYDMSKRTSVGLTYSKISNKSGAAYQPFTGQGALGSVSSVALPGEDPSTWAATIRHAF